MFVAGETSLLIDKSVVFPYKLLLRHTLSGRNSAVECQLPKLDVTGSIPVARSKFIQKTQLQSASFEILLLIPNLSGARMSQN